MAGKQGSYPQQRAAGYGRPARKAANPRSLRQTRRYRIGRYGKYGKKQTDNYKDNNAERERSDEAPSRRVPRQNTHKTQRVVPYTLFADTTRHDRITTLQYIYHANGFGLLCLVRCFFFFLFIFFLPRRHLNRRKMFFFVLFSILSVDRKTLDTFSRSIGDEGMIRLSSQLGIEET